MRYVYCLAWNVGPVAPRPTGLDGGTVEEVTVRELTAVVSDVEAVPVVRDVQRARVHQEVVQAASRFSSSVLPCRFGTVVTDEATLRSLLRARYRQFEAAHLRLEGKLELGVRILVGPEDSGPEAVNGEGRADEAGLSEGARYLLARRSRRERALGLRERAKRIRRELDDATAPHWADVEVSERTTSTGLLLSVSYLVERDRLPFFERAYGEFQERKPGLKLLFSGPWPPYSFATLDFSSPGGSCAGP